MKKIILGIATVALLSSSVSADGDIHLGVSSVDIAETSGIEYNIGYGGSKTWDSGIYFGSTVQFAYADLGADALNESLTATTMTGDFKLGYSIAGFTGYGLGGAAIQNLADSKYNSYGFGFGGGLEYEIFEHMSLAAEYKSYSLSTSDGIVSIDHDYTVTGLNVMYTW